MAILSPVIEQNLIGGRFVASSSGDTLQVLNPATNREVVGQVPAMGAAELAEVFDAAEAGSRTWKNTGAILRGQLLTRVAALIRSDAESLAALIVAEMGKTVAEASGEVGKSAEFFEYYGGLARLPFGEILPDARTGTFATQTREPLGVVVLITPWNDPLLTPARKLAPALLAGNAVVLKPATETPLIALRLARIIHDAGLPAGVLGTVTGRGAEIGDALSTDPRIRAVSFTGSTAVGLSLQRRLAGRSVRVQTEMGGKNAMVVLDDADLENATTQIVAGAFGQAGQRCTATSRLIVQKGIASEIRDRVARAVTSLKVGPGDEHGVVVGPVVNLRAQEDIRNRIASGVAEGATVLARATLEEEQSANGSYVEPTMLSVDRDNSLWREEVFGPVLGMLVVEDLEEAIAAVNDCSYGLSSAIFTKDLGAAYRFIDGVDTGQVSVNQPTTGWDIHQPFGGFKESGSPFKEQGLEALRFYTRVKTAAIRTI
jgi:acyl-CoA reductase-like NAD-dependent aldehyde dehydrogenase